MTSVAFHEQQTWEIFIQLKELKAKKKQKKMNNTNPRIGYRSTEVEDTEETKRQTVRKQKWSGRRLLV